MLKEKHAKVKKTPCLKFIQNMCRIYYIIQFPLYLAFPFYFKGRRNRFEEYLVRLSLEKFISKIIGKTCFFVGPLFIRVPLRFWGFRFFLLRVYDRWDRLNFLPLKEKPELVHDVSSSLTSKTFATKIYCFSRAPEIGALSEAGTIYFFKSVIRVSGLRLKECRETKKEGLTFNSKYIFLWT